MPARSKAQFRFMEGVAHGDIKKKGLPPEKAKEFLDVNPKALPEKKKATKSKAAPKRKAVKKKAK